MTSDILDTIETKSKTFKGIIDFVQKKQISFYDFSIPPSPEAMMLIISWRLSDQKTRFSIFLQLNKNKIDINEFRMIIIPRNTIKSPKDLVETKIKRKTRKFHSDLPDDS